MVCAHVGMCVLCTHLTDVCFENGNNTGHCVECVHHRLVHLQHAQCVWWWKIMRVVTWQNVWGKLTLYLFQSVGIIIVLCFCGSELENNQKFCNSFQCTLNSNSIYLPPYHIQLCTVPLQSFKPTCTWVKFPPFILLFWRGEQK